jgi:hypothetical protein
MKPSGQGRDPRRLAATVALLAAVAVAYLLLPQQPEHGGQVPPVSAPEVADAGEARILRAFESRQSDLWVQAGGTVARVLPDDNQGSRHQRFVLRLGSGHTVLISHNIDLAPRVDELKVGDRIDFRGEYEWGDRGGVVHWTHHDPDRRRDGGWLVHKGRRYQ